MGRLMFFYGAWSAIPPWHRAISRHQSPARWAVGTTIGRRRGRRGARAHANALLQGTRVPDGLASGLPRPCAPSCHLLPTRFGWRGDARAGDEGRAHQRLPTDRTPLRRHLTPGLARMRCPVWGGHLLSSLAHVLLALGQGCPWGVAIQPPPAHAHGPGWRHMEEPTPDALGER